MCVDIIIEVAKAKTFTAHSEVYSRIYRKFL